MSSIQSEAVQCAHNSNLCDGFVYFFQNKEEQLRQLKPFADKDSVYLTDLIRKAWNSFTDNDKAIYHEEANVTPADLEELIIGEEESDFGDDEDKSPNLENNDNLSPEKKEPFHIDHYDAAFPSIIYIGELNRIIVQDDYFSSNQKEIPRMLLHIGWTQLRQNQREEYIEKSKKGFICRKKGSPYHQIAKAEFDEFVEKIDNKEDQTALDALSKDACPHQDSIFNWHYRAEELFFVLTPSQRDEYYDMGYRHRTSKIARKLFANDKFLEDHVEGSNCMNCNFDHLQAADKKEYLKKATKIVQNCRSNLGNAVLYDMCWGTHAHKPDRRDQHNKSEFDTKLKEYSGKPFIVKQKFELDWLSGADYKELRAYKTFEHEVCTHFKGGLNSDAKWKKWMELTDAQQAQYYKKYLKNTHKTVAMSQYFHKVDPAFDQTNMYCNYCGFDRLDKAEKKDYMKKSKRRVIRIIKKELKESRKRLAKEELEKKSADGPEPLPDSDTTHLYIEDVDVYYVSKMNVHLCDSLEYNAFLPYLKKHIKSFSKDPENQHLPYSRICEKVEQSFWDLLDDKRKPYFDAVIRYVELKKLLEPLSSGDSYCAHVNKNSTLRFYHMSKADQAVYEKQLLEARVKLLRANPDLTDYFYYKRRSRRNIHEPYSHVEDSKDKNCHEKRIPTAFMCYVHAVCPLKKQQDPIFKKNTVYQQKWILGMKWSEFDEKQKAVYYEKQRRVQDRVNVKQFFELFTGLTYDAPEQCDKEIQTSP
uniref:HMG box domain-containing protein n=1 Tax=Panagrellus redivivus TaxID=6233 RepID=A0A7E4VJN2_PANRE